MSVNEMILVFHRTGQRRYAVEAQRSKFPDLLMSPAPGYDKLIPHDLMHLVVEAQLGLTRGIFGQLAAGGDAGTFRADARQHESARESARVRKRVRVRGKKLLKQGRTECGLSERATFICWCEWQARSQSSDRTLAQRAKQVRDTARAADSRVLNQKKLDEICKHLDHLSAHWSNLEIGQSLAVRWPDLAVVTTSND